MVIDTKPMRRRYRALRRRLNERTLREWAGAEALAAGRGGVAAVRRVTGLSRLTIARGVREVQSASELPPDRLRVSGAGRKRAEVLDPELKQALIRLVDSGSRGDPESPLRWTSKSARHLSAALTAQKHPVGKSVVCAMLQGMGFSLQANSKTREGSNHPDRDAQFEHINARATAALKAGLPVISVDTKKKELVGDFKNGGREWRPKGDPQKVRVHDFIIDEDGKGRVSPYGVYDLANNIGWVGVGIHHDTAAFAVATIERWWKNLGRRRYPKARTLMISADGGGSNGTRVRLWKWELQGFADRSGLVISVCHLPPGTSKWNKIEHRLFSFITQNWRGKPLESYATILKLIAATTTSAGLRVYTELDTHPYEKGVQVSDEQMQAIRLEPDAFHGEWNYTIKPRKARR
jgi:hypothetical protein